MVLEDIIGRIMERNDRTVRDILNDLDDIAMVSIEENNIGHAYFGEDIEEIDEDILNRIAVWSLVVKRSYGFAVHIEI